MTAGHRNQGKSLHVKNRGHSQKKKKKGVPGATTDPTIKNGVRVGYHSEAANPPELKDNTASGEGMKIGYHSEAANPPKERSGCRRWDEYRIPFRGSQYRLA